MIRQKLQIRGNVYFILRNLIITISITLFTALIAALMKNIADFISMIGGFCSVLIAFFFPCFIYVKSNSYEISHYKNISSIVLCSFLTIMGFTAGILSAISLFNK